ncbi:hypothetical protein ACFSQ3_04360 [Sphingobacterium corticis]|uniref:Lipid A 3-O-deacylase PagL n=1 Tax=Sphingobacterium corticis TaxID=1812823 RepID=A0ABW5NJW6_9SPHI
MTRAFIILTLSILYTVACYAQEILPQNKASLDVFVTGLYISREQPIAKNQSAELGVGMMADYFIGSDVKIHVRPSARLSYAYYYDRLRRTEKQRNTDLNSGNIIGADFITGFHVLNGAAERSNFVYLISPFWGLNRQLGKSKIQYHFKVGPAIASKSISNDGIGIYVNTGFAYCF